MTETAILFFSPLFANIFLPESCFYALSEFAAANAIAKKEEKK